METRRVPQVSLLRPGILLGKANRVRAEAVSPGKSVYPHKSFLRQTKPLAAMLSPSLRPDKTEALSPEEPSCQIQFPLLANQIVSEAMVRLFFYQPEARTLVNAMRRSQHALCP